MTTTAYAQIIPLVVGRPSTDGYGGVEFDCRWCATIHRHAGWGHHRSHCTNEWSPYLPNGVLITAGPRTRFVPFEGSGGVG